MAELGHLQQRPATGLFDVVAMSGDGEDIDEESGLKASVSG